MKKYLVVACIAISLVHDVHLNGNKLRLGTYFLILETRAKIEKQSIIVVR